MASRNEYLLLEQKCLKQYEFAEPYLTIKKPEISFPEGMRARFGFYFLVLKMYTDLSECSDIINSITDTDFNVKFFDQKDSDEGVDAIYLDEENNNICLFNFKYKEKFDPNTTPKLDEALATSKFLSAIATQNNNFTGRMHDWAQIILDKLSGKELWDIRFYIVSNNSQALRVETPELINLKDLYGINIISIGLDDLAEELSLRPRNIDATLILNREVVMKFQEDDLSSNTSYIVNLSLPELIRITSDSQEMRDLYDWEHENELRNIKMDHQVLYDNVRGFIGRTRFNSNIEYTLDNDPMKFFYYNNGITIVADDVLVDQQKMQKNIKLVIKNLQVINGGQTLRTIHNYHVKNNGVISEAFSQARIMVRLLKVTNEELKSRIAEYNNSQNAISQRDLKSLRKEQIQLEEFLEQNSILYERKRGDTGRDKSQYETVVGMELMGQMLLSVAGLPEQISNKKREIFNTHYNKLFAENSELLSSNTVEIIRKYRNIERTYRQSRYKPTTQKQMYILYLCNKFSLDDYNDVISKFEGFITTYSDQMPNDKKKAEARYLIEPAFREMLTSYFRDGSDSENLN